MVFVLGQVRFSAVLQMERYIPEIQERLRRSGFPRFSTRQTQELTFGAQPQMRQTTRWAFASKDADAAVILAPDFVVLEASRYDVFETFVDRLQHVIEIVGDVAEVALAERLGLRYVDLIRPRNDHRLDDFLAEGLCGLDEEQLGVSQMRSRHETVAVSEIGQLMVRLIQTRDGTFLPPDLDPTALKFDHIEKIEPPELATILDIDHYSVKSRDYDPKALVEGMWQLRELCLKAFLLSVTKGALKEWGAVER